MRVAFAGTPPFAARALAAIAAAGHEVPLVLTQPDRPAGRGMRLAASAVSAQAARLGLPAFKPATLREPDAQAVLRQCACDVLVVAAYGLILPRAVLDIPPCGCINIHASLLPRWRGAAPVQRALLAGDGRTGVSIMRMDEGLDTGPVLLRREVAIEARDTAGSLTERLAAAGADAVVEALARLDALAPQPQEEAGATYAAKIAKAEARLDWTRGSAELDRRIRAFNPFPGAETELGAERLKVWEAEPIAAEGAPGEVLEARDGRLVVACGTGALRLSCLQRAGARRMQAPDFLRGTPLSPGTRLGTAGVAPIPVTPENLK